MSTETAATIEQEAVASELSAAEMSLLQKTAYYLESRYNLWRRRAIPHFSASPAEFKIIEKAAAYCIQHDFEPHMYFQSQVDDLETVEMIADYEFKNFYNKPAIERANAYRKARAIRDKAQFRPSKELPVGSFLL